MKDNLFSANHRNAMIAKYNYTEAMTVTVDDLLMEATLTAGREQLERDYITDIIQGILDNHDCHLSPDSGCICTQERA